MPRSVRGNRGAAAVANPRASLLYMGTSFGGFATGAASWVFSAVRLRIGQVTFMARMHARTRGKSRSHPIEREEAPEWQGLNKDEIAEQVEKLAREGMGTAEIGLVLRDQYAVPDVRLATGKSLTAILDEKGLTPNIPEDLQNLMKRAVRLRGHLDTHRKDTHNRRALQLIESKIRRLSKYYRKNGRLPADWKYSPGMAKLAVE